MISVRSFEDVVDAADGWHLFGTEWPKEEIVFLLPGHYLVHGHCGQHLQPDCRTRRLYPVDYFTEQLVGLYVTESITEKRRWRLSFLVLPSNSPMVTYPNNTLAQYFTNLPRRISLSDDWECGLTEIHYPHNWYNVRNARLTVEHDGNVETDAYFEDGYFHIQRRSP